MTKAPELSCNEVTIFEAEPKLTPPAIVTVGKLTVPETEPAPTKNTGPAVAVKSPAVATTFPLVGIVNCFAFKSNLPAVKVNEPEVAVIAVIADKVTILFGDVPVLLIVNVLTVAGKPVPVI